MSQATVFIPIESYARELDGKLLLAASLARKGFRVVLADHIFVRYMTYLFSNGIYIGKNMNFYPAPFGKMVKNRFGLMVRDTWYFDLLKKKGYSIVYLEEEGGFFSRNVSRIESFLENRFSPEILHEDDFIATWGKTQEQYYKKKKTLHSDNIISTGNPRFDLYMKRNKEFYEEDAKNLYSQYDEFVLINTNYSLANNAIREKGMFRESSIYSTNNRTLQIEGVQRWDEQMHRFSLLVKLVFSISKEFPHINFVIRPHPSEREKTYQEIFNGVDNVVVRRDDAVGAWIKSCKVLIHDGCTTGLEAAIMDKPIINFNPVASSVNNNELLSNFGIRVTDEETVIKLLHKIEKGSVEKANYKKAFDHVSNLLANCCLDEDSYSVDKITKIVQKISINKKSFSLVGNHLLIRCTYIGYVIANFLRTIVSAIIDGNFSRYRNRKSTMYGIDKLSLNKKISKINEIYGSETKAHHISKHCFIIEPALSSGK